MSKITFDATNINLKNQFTLAVKRDGALIGVLLRDHTWQWCPANGGEVHLTSAVDSMELAMQLCREHLGEKVVSRSQLLDEMVRTVASSLAAQFRHKLPVVTLGVKRGDVEPGFKVRMGGAGVDAEAAKEICDDLAANAVGALAGLLFPDD